MSAYCQSGRDSRHLDTAVMGQQETNGGAAKIRLIVLIADTAQLGFDGVRRYWRNLRDVWRARHVLIPSFLPKPDRNYDHPRQARLEQPSAHPLFFD
jgi:hypothetical protein